MNDKDDKQIQLSSLLQIEQNTQTHEWTNTNHFRCRKKIKMKNELSLPPLKAGQFSSTPMIIGCKRIRLSTSVISICTTHSRTHHFERRFFLCVLLPFDNAITFDFRMSYCCIAKQTNENNNRHIGWLKWKISIRSPEWNIAIWHSVCEKRLFQWIFVFRASFRFKLKIKRQNESSHCQCHHFYTICHHILYISLYLIECIY